jgi:hypothetical protein
MTVEEEKNSNETQIAPATDENYAPDNSANELRESIWSVVSFDKSEANNLTYAEAEQKMSELLEQKVSGLCIVTDETAARIAGKV